MDINEILTTRASKINFLKGLIRLAKCDGNLDEEEFKFYQQAAYSMQLNDEDVEELNKTWNRSEKISLTFASSKEKMFFLIQAVQLCWVDNEYTEIEKKEMQVIAEELGIDRQALKKVEEWVYEGVEWNRRGEELLSLQEKKLSRTEYAIELAKSINNDIREALN